MPFSFAKRPPLPPPLPSRPFPSRLRSKTRPPPSKSCLATSRSERDLSTSGEACVRKTVRFPDDKMSLERVILIPARAVPRPPTFQSAQITKTKSFIMYTSDKMGSNQRFLHKVPGRSGPPRDIVCTHWESVVRARSLAAMYSAEPRPPRSAPSFVASHVPNAAFGVHSPSSAVSEAAPVGSPKGSAFDMSSLACTLPDASSDVSSAFDVSSLARALPGPDASSDVSAFDMSSLACALPGPDASSDVSAFDMSSLARALPGPDASSDVSAFDMSSLAPALPTLDASSDVSSLAPVPKSMVASHPSPKARHARVVQTHVEADPFSITLFRLCELFLVVGSVFPWMVPVYAALVLLLVCGRRFF
ncbi:uncharacterized protein PGRI_011280 [Penicillium griseofulvum]|uniref:Uncharacterized protein n=1 Tax=Penicillium patulum TaxID=5078 RepID=A0A135LE62_PENPA|nr:uncharacterized protein PGRI_011280 [Penicillium griseofulvum]KXG47258.1 hypothetical protein PGRI_011280 [Penicillium griseofulvum]